MSSSAALIGSADISATGTELYAALSSLVGSAIINGNATITYRSQTSLSSSAVLTANATVIHNSICVLNSTATMTSQGGFDWYGVAALVDGSRITGYPHASAVSTMRVTWDGTFHPNMHPWAGKSHPVCNSTLTAKAINYVSGVAVLVAGATLDASAINYKNAQASIVDAVAEIDARGDVIYGGVSSLSDSSVLGANAVVQHHANANLSSEAILTVGGGPTNHLAVAALVCGSQVGALAYQNHVGLVNFVVTSVLIPRGSKKTFQSSTEILHLLDNYIKDLYTANATPPTIMAPATSLQPPPSRPGYGVIYQPTWCNVGGTCDGVLCAITQKQQVHICRLRTATL